MKCGNYKSISLILTFCLMVVSCEQSASKISADNESETAIADFSMTTNRIGPIRLGMSLDELQSIDPNPSVKDRGFEDNVYKEYTYSVDSAGNQIGVIASNNDETIWRVFTASPKFFTSHGASVGMTLSELQNIYSDGRIIRGSREVGPIFHFILPAHTAGTGVFRFDASSVSDECLEDTSQCDRDLAFERSVEYYVQ